VDLSKIKLGEHLDAVWHTEIGKASVLDCNLSHLSFAEWTVLAGWDAAATLGPPAGRLEFGSSGVITIYDSCERKVSAVELMTFPAPDRSLLIAYPGTSRGVVAVDCPKNSSAAIVEHEAVNLFLALQFIRDHSDSILFLPRSARETRFAAAAEELRLNLGHFHRLMSWFPAISKYVGRRSYPC
jgi:hypothetical protein